MIFADSVQQGSKLHMQVYLCSVLSMESGQSHTTSRIFEVSIFLLLIIKTPQIIGKILVVGYWSIEAIRA